MAVFKRVDDAEAGVLHIGISDRLLGRSLRSMVIGMDDRLRR
jgi:hypothetical protein